MPEVIIIDGEQFEYEEVVPCTDEVTHAYGWMYVGKKTCWEFFLCEKDKDTSLKIAPVQFNKLLGTFTLPTASAKTFPVFSASFCGKKRPVHVWSYGEQVRGGGHPPTEVPDETLAVPDGKQREADGQLPTEVPALDKTSSSESQTVDASRPRVDRASGSYSLKDEGATIRIAMPSGEFTVKRKIGLKYLAWFIRHQGEESKPLTVYTEVRSEPGRSSSTESFENQAAVSKDGVGVDDKADRKAIESYNQRLRAIKEERVQAKAQEDSNQIRILDEECFSIEAELESIKGFGNLIRQFSDDSAKMREVIRKGIQRAYDDIGKGPGVKTAREEFIREMKQGLTLGKRCIYMPSPGVEWEVEQ